MNENICISAINELTRTQNNHISYIFQSRYLILEKGFSHYYTKNLQLYCTTARKFQSRIFEINKSDVR